MVHWRPGYFRLVQRCRALGWDSRAILATTDEHVEDVLVNVAHALSLRALGRLLAAAGDEPGAARCATRAARTETALLERCWDERRGLFLDLAGRGERRVTVSTWSALAPLALGDAIPEVVRLRLAEEHLLHPGRYRAACGVPSVSMEEPSFRPAFTGWRTWRGPSWINAAPPAHGGRNRRPWVRLVDARRRPGGRARRGDVIFTGACDRPHRSPSSSRR